MPALADTPCIATKVRGTATLLHLEGVKPLVVGMAAGSGNRLRTGVDGRAEIRCFDGLVLAIGSDTEIALGPLLRKPGGLHMAVDLLRGIVRALFAPSGALDGVDIATPDAVASVRSTDWIVDAQTPGTAIFVATGRVAVSAQGVTVNLDAGDGTDVPRGGAPAPVRQWGAPRVAGVAARTAVP